MRTVLTGDLGGTKCRYALVSEDYGVHCVQRIDTVRERGTFLERTDTAIRAVLASARDLPGLEPPRAFGIGAAGVVDAAGEGLGDPPNLPLGGFPLRSWLQERADLPVTLLNDGRASAWGEFLRGHAAGRDPLLCLFFGTGIGIGTIVDGKPYVGGTNAAGEIGHTIYRPGGRVCPCGGAGHFEAYCGGRAMTERAAAEIGAAADGSWSVGDIVTAAAGSDDRARAAQRILDEAGEAAATVIVNAVMLFNPRAVVLGGGVLSGWPGLRPLLEAAVRRETDTIYHGELQFADTLGGSDAILWGAAAATGALWA